MDGRNLIQRAFEARLYSYAPYSHFYVGAALLTTDGTVHQGCNVENASYGATLCAERTAAVQAVSQGYQKFQALAVVGGFEDPQLRAVKDYAYPCGICRQFLREFAVPGMKIYVAKSEGEYLETTLEALLPNAFGPECLE